LDKRHLKLFSYVGHVMW